MKIIYIVLNVSCLESFMQLLHAHLVKNFQIIEKAQSVAVLGQPRMDTSVWPGYSSCVVIQEQNNAVVEAVLSEVRKHNKNRLNDDEAMQAFVWGAESYVIE
jgi:hypothetical protein